jgi:hypothetical protein
MLHGVEYEPDKQLVRVRMRGEFSVADYREAVSRIWAGEFPPVVQLWDLRELDYSTIDLQVMEQVRSARDGIAPPRSGSRSAVVVEAYVQKMVVSLFVAADAGSGRVLEVFTDMGAAEAWCLDQAQAG